MMMVYTKKKTQKKNISFQCEPLEARWTKYSVKKGSHALIMC